MWTLFRKKHILPLPQIERRYLRLVAQSIANIPATLFGKWTGIMQLVQRLATDRTVRPSNPGEGEIFRSRPDRPWDQPSLPHSGLLGLFPWVKWRRFDVKHLRPSSTVVKERVKDCLYSPCWPSWPVLGWPLPFHLFTLFGNLEVNKVIVCLTNWSSTPGSATVFTVESHRKTVS